MIAKLKQVTLFIFLISFFLCTAIFGQTSGNEQSSISKPIYYFAYGSNLNLKQMKIRCPHANFIKRAYLEGYKFIYDGYSNRRNGGVANIVESKNNIVWGGLFALDEDCLKALDRYEGYPSSYNRKEFLIVDDNGNSYRALAYFHPQRAAATPHHSYRQIIISGAKQCNLPEEYVSSTY